MNILFGGFCGVLRHTVYTWYFIDLWNNSCACIWFARATKSTVWMPNLNGEWIFRQRMSKSKRKDLAHKAIITIDQSAFWQALYMLLNSHFNGMLTAKQRDCSLSSSTKMFHFWMLHMNENTTERYSNIEKLFAKSKLCEMSVQCDKGSNNTNSFVCDVPD